MSKKREMQDQVPIIRLRPAPLSIRAPTTIPHLYQQVKVKKYILLKKGVLFVSDLFVNGER